MKSQCATLLAVALLNLSGAMADPAHDSAQVTQSFEYYAEHALLETVVDRVYRTPALRAEVELAAQRWLASIASHTGAELPLDQAFVLAGHTVDLAIESFDVFVPGLRPQAGYGLLVFIPPEPSFQLPDEWRGLMERRGIIVVAPRNAGNGHPVMFRRLALALHAHENAVRRFPIDPERSYVGGWSGGSRVALALAIAYPDLFRGALLIAGSDPVDSGSSPFPNLLPTDPPLLDQLRASRLVMLTGERDRPALRRDRRTLKSMLDAGLDGTLIRARDLGHTLPDARSLAHALNAIER